MGGIKRGRNIRKRREEKEKFGRGGVRKNRNNLKIAVDTGGIDAIVREG